MDITVVGRKRASVPPERATLRLVAGFESGDKGDCLNRTTSLVGKLSAHIQALEGAGVSPITWYAVQPITTRSWRPYSDAGAVLPLRHAASAVVKVTFRDFHALAQFAHQVGGSAGVSLEHVEWSLAEATRDQLVGEVLGQAVADAADRALTIARATGATAVRPLEVADPGLLSGVAPGGPGRGEGAGMARAFAAVAPGPGEGIDLAPEDVVVEAEVHARFATTGG